MKKTFTYTNNSSMFHVLRIVDTRYPLERVVFPRTKITIEVRQDAVCEISDGYITTLISERTLCSQLLDEV